MDRLELALQRAMGAAREEGRKDGAARKPRIGRIFPVLREAYARGFAETYRRPRMGRPVKLSARGRKNSSVGLQVAAPSGAVASAVDLLPTDAALRRGVAGPGSTGSSVARAGVLS